MLENINLIAVLVAAVSTFVVGGIWYGPLFSKQWQVAVGLSDEQVAAANMGKTFFGAFIAQIMVAITLSVLLRGVDGVLNGAILGAMIALGIAVAHLLTNYLFEQRTRSLLLINAGYMVLSTALSGAIIAGWPF